MAKRGFIDVALPLMRTNASPSQTLAYNGSKPFFTLLALVAPKTFSKFNGCHEVILKRKKSEARSRIKVLGLASSLEEDGPDIVARCQYLERGRRN